MASTYTMVAYGSQGDAVRQLQSELNRHGYQLDEDGVFGKKTRAAVRDYQKKKSLRLDGIAGDETWGSLLASPAPAEETTPAPVARPSAKTAEALARLEKGYAPSEDVTAAQAYRDSVAALQPDAYDSAYRQRLAALYDEIEGRQAFSYDPETATLRSTPGCTGRRAAPPWRTPWDRRRRLPAGTAPATRRTRGSRPTGSICRS